MWSSISSPNKALPLAGALLASLTSAIPMSMSSSVSPSAHPTPISISASLVANVAQNTHTSTVGPNGKPTSIPIVGGPDCWFCPEADEDDDDDNAGWALMGLGAPGTYIPSPAPSGFSDPMPPITVEANGNPSYGPSPTEDEDEEPTKVKRSPIPTKTHYVDSSKFKSLDSTVKNKKWQDKEGWAIQAAQPPTGVVPIPNHFLVVAGYVHITPKDREERDDCGELKQVVRTITRDYDGFLYDISAPDGKKIIMVPRGESGATWDNGKKGFTYSSLGAIKDGLSKDKIKEIGESIAKNMGPYSYATNNCRTFVNKLYDHIKK